ncbi:hypothetical protein BpHYR1_033905 [Brachionus plicatilis]|uniref:Uncharacterized protein n=1 Tax=Brachionus plicatilis TaxID=10195 RepID=A0A3M7PQD7_BRAPC|nr:hypothetical protein BpHYR1_033905 [Brachionus plicatilis]
MDNLITNLVDSEFLKSRNRFQINESRNKRKIFSDDNQFDADKKIAEHSNNILYVTKKMSN